MAPRTAQTPVYLNVYDLTPANEYISGMQTAVLLSRIDNAPCVRCGFGRAGLNIRALLSCAALGVGFYHTGIEIAGDEYSFANGAGIFVSTPKQAAGAIFRESIELGSFSGSYTEAKQIAYSLRPEFGGDTYNLITKNCNAYSEALCQSLLGKSIPAYVNRAAYLGSFLSCLMPADLGGQAPVGGDASVAPTSSRLTNGPTYSAFAGSGQAVGGASTSSSSTSNTSDASTLADRREKLRMAALRRFESQQE